MSRKFKVLWIVSSLVFCLCQGASAELAAVGPEDTTNHYPSWYMDENGVALELCLTPTNCIFDPTIPNNLFSSIIGFGEKAFYWSADAELTGTGAKGSLRLALVASFSGSTTEPVPINGEQITFVQIELSEIIGLLPGGVYTVIHPYGVLTNLIADSSGTIPAQKQEIGCASAPCDFAAVLKSEIGPFLRWDPLVAPVAPVGFIGNPAVAHRIIGSPFGTNVLRIDGPNAGGPAISTKQTNLFKVQGKLFSGTVPTPLFVNRATYTRPLLSQIEVFATSSRLAILNVSGTGATIPMTTDGNGNFFAQIVNPLSFPESIIVTAIEPGRTATTVRSRLVDIVSITSAEFHPVAKRLTVRAYSSDQLAPLPTLTVLGFGDLNPIPGNFPLQEAVFTGLTVPPAEVIVSSSAGGVAKAFVTVIARPLARNDTALTLRTAPAIIDVLANDIAYPVGSGILDPATVTIVTPPAKGAITSIDPATGRVTYTPNPGSFTKPIETDTFKYTVKDSFGQESNLAVVTVTVVASETLTVTKAVYITSSKTWQITGKTTVKSGNKITLYVGPDTTGAVIGTASVNLFGGWAFSKLNSPVIPGGATSITAQSSLGTVTTFPLTIK